jgi:hypothetical protein
MEGDKILSDVDELVSMESDNGNGFVEVKFGVSIEDKICLPDDTSDTSVFFLFKEKSVQDERDIEKKAFIVSEVNKIDNSAIDMILYKRLMLRKCLYKVNDWTLKRSNGWIVKDDWEKLLTLSAPILNSALILFDIFTSLKEDEEKLIERQAAGLYASSNGSVLNPHPILSYYLSSLGLWEKLGIGNGTVDSLKLKDYVGYRIISSAESDAMRRNMHSK